MAKKKTTLVPDAPSADESMQTDPQDMAHWGYVGHKLVVSVRYLEDRGLFSVTDVEGTTYLLTREELDNLPANP